MARIPHPALQGIGLEQFRQSHAHRAHLGLWHIPYWLFFLGEDVIKSYTSIGMPWFIFLGFAALFPTALVFGELRLKTNSLWPAFIAHNITNAVSAPLIIEGFVKFRRNDEFIFSPNTDGVVMMILFWGVGLWMLRKPKSATTVPQV